MYIENEVAGVQVSTVTSYGSYTSDYYYFTILCDGNWINTCMDGVVSEKHGLQSILYYE